MRNRKLQDISLPELSKFLHLPVREAHKRLGISKNALTKLCRHHDILAWPAKTLRANLKVDAIIKAGTSSAPPKRSKKLADREERKRVLTTIRKAKARVLFNPLGLRTSGRMGSVEAGKARTAKTGVTAALKVVRPPYTVEQLAQYAKFEAMRSMPPHHR